MDITESEKDIFCGQRSSDGRLIIRFSGFGKYTIADAAGFAAGTSHVWKRDSAPDTHPRPNVVRTRRPLARWTSTASLREPSRMGSANVLHERNPHLSEINNGGWDKIIDRRFRCV